MSQEVTDRQRSYTLFMLVLVFTSSHVDRQIMGILGQPIKESLLITDTQLGLLTGIMFAVFYATLGMPMAMWADRNNRRNLISFSVFLWSLMTALCAAATNFMQLLLLRIGVGVGEAGSESTLAFDDCGLVSTRKTLDGHGDIWHGYQLGHSYRFFSWWLD